MCIFSPLTRLLSTTEHHPVLTDGVYKDSSAPVHESSNACGIFDINLTPPQKPPNKIQVRVFVKNCVNLTKIQKQNF